MAQFPLILQQSMTSMDELQATMEEVRPLLWFTAGLFVFTLLLTTILIFRKQHQKKKKKHASKAANQTPDIQEKQVIEKKPEPEIKPEEKPTVQVKHLIYSLFRRRTRPVGLLCISGKSKHPCFTDACDAQYGHGWKVGKRNKRIGNQWRRHITRVYVNYRYLASPWHANKNYRKWRWAIGPCQLLS